MFSMFKKDKRVVAYRFLELQYTLMEVIYCDSFSFEFQMDLEKIFFYKKLNTWPIVSNQ